MVLLRLLPHVNDVVCLESGGFYFDPRDGEIILQVGICPAAFYPRAGYRLKGWTAGGKERKRPCPKQHPPSSLGSSPPEKETPE